MTERRKNQRRLRNFVRMCGCAMAAVAASSLCLATGPVAGAAPAPHNTWYVSGTGSDGRNGTAPSTAFRTVARALAAAQPGDQISLLAGRYSPFVVNVASITITASPQAHVIGTPTARDVVLVDAANVTIRGLDVSGCVPNARPLDGFGDGASAGVRVAPGADNATLDHLTVHDSHGVNLQRQPFGCHGIFLQDSFRATVSNSNVFHNGEGIFVDGGGAGTVIRNNAVHDNDVLIVDTVTPGYDDWGAVGIGLTDATGVTVTGNTVYSNNGPSHDWGFDGGAFEIFQSSRNTISRNVAYNNNDVLETGAGPANNCVGNVFSANVVSGRTAKSTVKVSAGFILRCAQNMVITANKITDVDWWTFWIYQPRPGGREGGKVNGLKITNNVVVQNGSQIYSLGSLPNRTSMTVENNKYSYVGRFATVGTNQNVTFARWRALSGFERRSTP